MLNVAKIAKDYDRLQTRKYTTKNFFPIDLEHLREYFTTNKFDGLIIMDDVWEYFSFSPIMIASELRHLQELKKINEFPIFLQTDQKNTKTELLENLFDAVLYTKKAIEKQNSHIIAEYCNIYKKILANENIFGDNIPKKYENILNNFFWDTKTTFDKVKKFHNEFLNKDGIVFTHTSFLGHLGFGYYRYQYKITKHYPKIFYKGVFSNSFPRYWNCFDDIFEMGNDEFLNLNNNEKLDLCIKKFGEQTATKKLELDQKPYYCIKCKKTVLNPKIFDLKKYDWHYKLCICNNC